MGTKDREPIMQVGTGHGRGHSALGRQYRQELLYFSDSLRIARIR